MTEKRFMVDDAGTLIDMTNRNTYDYVSDVCDLLNELAEEKENITLLVQHNYEESKRIINRYVDKIKELEKENKELKQQREELFIRERDTKNDWRELKQENERLKSALKELKEIGDYQADRIQELNDENEQLKQLLDYADDLIQSYMSVHNRDEWENVKKNITGDV